MTPMTPDVAAICASLTKAQREAVFKCGDVADRFPCQTCHLKGCIFTKADRATAADACNCAGAAVNGSGYDALRAHLIAQDRKGEGV